MEDIGAARRGLSKYSKKIYVYQCVRQPGYVFECSAVKYDLYQRIQCKRQRKMETITIVNDTVVPGKQYPEDRHHNVCTPLPASAWYAAKSFNDVINHTSLCDFNISTVILSNTVNTDVGYMPVCRVCFAKLFGELEPYRLVRRIKFCVQ